MRLLLSFLKTGPDMFSKRGSGDMVGVRLENVYCLFAFCLYADYMPQPGNSVKTIDVGHQIEAVTLADS